MGQCGESHATLPSIVPCFGASVSAESTWRGSFDNDNGRRRSHESALSAGILHKSRYRRVEVQPKDCSASNLEG